MHGDQIVVLSLFLFLFVCFGVVNEQGNNDLTAVRATMRLKNSGKQNAVNFNVVLQHNTKYSSFSELLEHYTVDINIWEQFSINELYNMRIYESLSSCSKEGSEIEATYVAVLAEDVSYLEKAMTYYRSKYWNVIFISSEEHNSKDICVLNNKSNEEVFVTLLSCNHTITDTNSTLGEFLALYNSGDVVYSDTGEIKNSVPTIDNHALDVLAQESTKRFKKSTIAVKLFYKSLGFLKGKYVSKPSTKYHHCCTYLGHWNAVNNSEQVCMNQQNHMCKTYPCERPNNFCGLIEDKQVFCNTGGKICWCAREKKKKLQYTWTSPTGKYLTFDSQEFCKILGDRYVYYIGDSKTNQVHAVFMNRLIEDKAPCANQVKTLGSDYLIDTPEGYIQDRYASLKTNMEFVFSDSKGREVIVVINAGAHIGRVVGDFVQMMKGVGDYVRTNKELLIENQVKFLWQSQTARASHCESYTGPILPNSQFDDAAWSRLMFLDVLTMGYFKSFELIKGFLDISPLYLRVDSHALDCSHNCIDRNQGTSLDFALLVLYQALMAGLPEDRWLYQGIPQEN